jgi:hypothetical protein
MSNIVINLNDQHMITDYYKELDNNIIENLINSSIENQLVNNFLNLTIKNNLYLFKKKKDKWYFKSENQIKKDFITKKKTILRKHASSIIDISKNISNNIESNITLLNNNLKNDLKELNTVYNIYKSLKEIDLLNFTNNINISNLKKLGSIMNYSGKVKYIKNEQKYIAEYTN